VILQVVDVRWREHLENMDYLREGVHLRSMAQKDPLVEYTSEGERMFTDLGRAIRGEVVLHLFHAEIAPQDGEQGAELLPQPGQNGGGNGANLQYDHQSLAGADAIAQARDPQAVGAASSPTKLGRNDACWCGSGKKFKKCHGA
jgi:preprotein translocase subunit SecA